MTPNEQFAEEYSAPMNEVRSFRLLGRERANMLEHWSNGDPHKQGSDDGDKQFNQDLWERDAALLGNQMTDLAQDWGFDHLDFGVGLYPTLQKSGSEIGGSVHFSYD